MRRLSALLSIILVLMAGSAGVFYFGGTLRGRTTIQTAPARDYPEAFAAIVRLVESGSAPQILGSAPLSENHEGYTLVNITLTLSNRGLLPAEWLHTRIAPAPGDIAVYALTGEGSDVAPRGSAQVDLKLVTTAPADAVRDITVQYYVYGVKREIVLN